MPGHTPLDSTRGWRDSGAPSGGRVAAARRGRIPFGTSGGRADSGEARLRYNRLLQRRGDGGEAWLLSHCYSDGGATTARRGCAPLGSFGGGFMAVRSSRSLPIPLAAVASVVRRERVPSGSSGVRSTNRGAAALPLLLRRRGDCGEAYPLFLLRRRGFVGEARPRSSWILWKRGNGGEARPLSLSSSSGGGRCGCSLPALPASG